MPKHLKQKFTETLHKNPWWEYKHDIYTKPNGEDGDYYYADAGGFALVVPMLPDGRIVLTLQFRYLPQKTSIEFPAGDIESGEIEANARRELQEETGYIAKKMVKLGVFEADSPMSKNMAHVFLAYVQDSPGTQSLEDTEEIEVLTRRPDEFQRMVQNGEVQHGPTLAAWALVQSYLMKQDDANSRFLEAPNVKRLTDNLFGLLDF